ncbi:MAG: glycosyl hydrolase family 95 catalytic domain-containing protein, partial [Planctomycetota bacterium]
MSYAKWTAPVVLLSSALLLAGAAGACEPVIAYPDALDATAVSVKQLEGILENALIVGNGDLNALVYTEALQLRVKLTKNDVWDARFDAKLDPPLPKFEWVKRLASQPAPHGGRSTILQNGWGNHGADAYHAHAYPCPRACALVAISDRIESIELEGADESLSIDLSAETLAPPSPPGRLDLRRAAARVGGATDDEPPTEIRILAQSNVVLIESPQVARLLPIGSPDLPKVESGEKDGLAWIVQQIPGDPDWPGMSFAVASTSREDRTAVAVVTSREAEDPKAAAIELARSTLAKDPAEVVRRHEAEWTRFWSASGVDLADRFLRDAWYRNLYFLRCVTRPSAIAPGLFAGLIHDRPAWHGDYHTNYNIQQTFWSAYVTNHPDLAEPYDRLISEYLPRARWLARRVFDLDGAYYPHVLFAYEPPHPEKCKSPNGRQYIHHVWGFTQGVNGFTVQPLWWHYKYAPDRKLLEEVVYPAVRDVAVFQAELMDRCERTDDGRIVLGPSVSPEHWGWTRAFARNRIGTFDIAM